MKRVKFGIVIVFLVAAIYCIVSFGIFFDKKASIDTQLQLLEQSLEEGVQPQNQSVVIQNIESITCHECNHPVQQNNVQPDFIVINDSDINEQQLPDGFVDNQSELFVKANSEKNVIPLSSSSFITMNPISESYVIDQETQNALDVLIGHDVDEFVRLVLQSNNNIVSREACRSCGMYAFFNGIKHHRQLTVKDIVMLQKLLANLYRFVERMQKLSHEPLILPEQYEALQELHRSQDVKNDIKLKQRFAATSAALKKLQNIKYNR